MGGEGTSQEGGAGGGGGETRGKRGGASRGRETRVRGARREGRGGKRDIYP